MGQSMPAYEAIGIEENGQYKQLNTNLLQIENEYYSDIRPKRNSISGEKPLTSLNEYGVEYIEVRCLDLNPFEPLGVSLEQVRFMDLFLSYCLFTPSPKLSDAECQEVARNQKQVVVNGRDPEFTLERLGDRVLLTDWAQELIVAMQPLAELMDSKNGQSHYRDALAQMQKRVQNPELTPSARILSELNQRQQSFVDFAFTLGQQHAAQFSEQRMHLDMNRWQSLSEQSLNEQARMESLPEPDFASFLADYSQKL